MMSSQQKTIAAPSVFTVESGMPFASALAEYILDLHGEKPENIAKIKVYLPTRRACRVFRDAMSSAAKSRALILPRIQAIGDTGEDDLFFSATEKETPHSTNAETSTEYNQIAEIAALPPPVSRLQRQALLARLIFQAKDFAHNFDQALKMAAALGHFMDQVYTEGLSWEALRTLVPEDFAAHWQITLEFLDIIVKAWPEILKERGCIDFADRRTRLICALTAHYQATPPEFPVIAAGTTGSIPAVAKFLGVVARLPGGTVILPGYDPDTAPDDWEHMGETHPQYGFRKLLEYMQAERSHILPLPSSRTLLDGIAETAHARRTLARTFMAPPETTYKWPETAIRLKENNIFSKSFAGLHLEKCRDIQEESEVIALHIRKTLETPGKTISLITSDRMLARRVHAACARWNIIPDDTAGHPLSDTPVFKLLSSFITLGIEHASPLALMRFLQGKYTSSLIDDKTYELLDKSMRGLKPRPGFSGLRDKIEAYDKTSTPEKQTLETYVQKIESQIQPFMKLCHPAQIYPYGMFLDSLLHAMTPCFEDMMNHHPEDMEDAVALIDFLNEIKEIQDMFPQMTAADFIASLHSLVKSVTLRTPYNVHPRVHILGQIEARLVRSDVVIMAGLNEGRWPSDPGYDPWMSGTMRTKFGLPGHERAIGLAAHDFVQGFCANQVIMTMVRRMDNAPAAPSRWIERLDTVLQASGLSPEIYQDNCMAGLAQQLYRPDLYVPTRRPAPRPPLSARPQSASVTDIEKWLRDPYSIYAAKILRLKPMDPIEKPADNREKGSILHEILHRFTLANMETLGTEPVQELQHITDDVMNEINATGNDWAYWRAHLESRWKHFVIHETDWRKTAKPYKTEIKATLYIQNIRGVHELQKSQDSGAPVFTLTGRADRIDRMHGGLALIDYKSGGTFNASGIYNGLHPQLGIEALMATQGGFADIPALPVEHLAYWVIAKNEIKTTIVDKDKKNGESKLENLIEDAKKSVLSLVSAYSDEKTPYFSVPNPKNTPKYTDYAHLSRQDLWLEGENTHD